MLLILEMFLLFATLLFSIYFLLFIDGIKKNNDFQKQLKRGLGVFCISLLCGILAFICCFLLENNIRNNIKYEEKTIYVNEIYCFSTVTHINSPTESLFIYVDSNKSLHEIWGYVEYSPGTNTCIKRKTPQMNILEKILVNAKDEYVVYINYNNLHMISSTKELRQII